MSYKCLTNVLQMSYNVLKMYQCLTKINTRPMHPILGSELENQILFILLGINLQFPCRCSF